MVKSNIVFLCGEFFSMFLTESYRYSGHDHTFRSSLLLLPA